MRISKTPTLIPDSSGASWRPWFRITSPTTRCGAQPRWLRLLQRNSRRWPASAASSGVANGRRRSRAGAAASSSARDGSAGFFARNVEGGITAIFQLRPASAPEQEAVLLADGVPQWFEPESGTLWFEQYFESPAPRFYPRTAHWDGERWGDSLPTDLPIYWTSPDLCRLYGVSEAGIVMRTRVSPP